MNGGGIPYHLRTNKAIDRQIFFEILNQLRMPVKIQDYRYISLGGPMLEDHHILHHQLGITKLESLERDKSVYSRQQFNKNFNCINCINSSMQDYLNNFERKENTIIWLDYTDTSWSKQFLELHTVLGKLEKDDICKITINANPDVLVDKDNMGLSKAEIFKQKASGKFLNENISENDVGLMDRFALTISRSIETVAQSALDLTEELSFYPITIFRYVDNKHQMLSITGIILDKGDDVDLSSLLSQSNLDMKEHISTSWDDIHEINVPDLTYRERFEINRMLPGEIDEETIFQLPFTLSKNPIKAKAAIKSYVKYYRYIPNFQKLAM